MKTAIALFGEAEKGAFRAPLFLPTLPDLHETLGNPPESSQGIPLAVKTILLGFPILYLRVHEEGYSRADYLAGLEEIKDHLLDGVALPGVGSSELLEPFFLVCEKRKALLFIRESDLFDYITEAA